MCLCLKSARYLLTYLNCCLILIIMFLFILFYIFLMLLPLPTVILLFDVKLFELLYIYTNRLDFICYILDL